MTYFNFSAISASLSCREGIEHAVLQSILNHAPSTQNDRVRMDNFELGGCWSDEIIQGVGSRDWTLKREKLTEQTLIRTKTFIDDALQWLVDEHYVKKFDVNVARNTKNAITRNVLLTLNNNSTMKVDL